MRKSFKTLVSGKLKEHGPQRFSPPKKTGNWGARCNHVIPELRRGRQEEEDFRDSGNSRVSPVIHGGGGEGQREWEAETAETGTA